MDWALDYDYGMDYGLVGSSHMSGSSSTALCTRNAHLHFMTSPHHMAGRSWGEPQSLMYRHAPWILNEMQGKTMRTALTTILLLGLAPFCAAGKFSCGNNYCRSTDPQESAMISKCQDI